MEAAPFKLEFYADENGREPVVDWIRRELTPAKRRAIVAAFEQILAYKGLGVCETEYGKPTSEKGIFEFRLRHNADEVLALAEARQQAGSRRHPEKARTKEPEKILLRVFFHPYGDKRILLLGAYDKGRHPSSRFQSKEVALAAKRLRGWKQRRQQVKKSRARKQG